MVFYIVMVTSGRRMYMYTYFMDVNKCSFDVDGIRSGTLVASGDEWAAVAATATRHNNYYDVDSAVSWGGFKVRTDDKSWPPATTRITGAYDCSYLDKLKIAGGRSFEPQALWLQRMKIQTTAWDQLRALNLALLRRSTRDFSLCPPRMHVWKPSAKHASSTTRSMNPKRYIEYFISMPSVTYQRYYARSYVTVGCLFEKCGLSHK